MFKRIASILLAVLLVPMAAVPTLAESQPPETAATQEDAAVLRLDLGSTANRPVSGPAAVRPGRRW